MDASSRETAMNTSISRTRTIRAVFSFGLVLFATRALAADAPSVAGVWEYKDPVGANSITFTLNPDGTGKVDDDAVRFSGVGDKMNIVTGGDTFDYTFKISGVAMTVSGGDVDKTTAFARKGAAPPKKGLGAKIKGLAGADAPKGETPKPDAPADESKAAVGRWEFKTDKAALVMTLDADGTGAFNGKPMKWTLKDGVLTTAIGDQSMQYKTAITGDALKLTLPGGAGDNSIAFARVKSGGGGDRPNLFDIAGKIGGGDAQPAAAGGLPGKWEANDGTIVLFNNDVNFVFNRRSVPFKAADGKITVNGATGAIQWDYKVEGDQLTLTMQGENQTLKRVGPPEGKAADANAGTAPAAGGGPAGIWQSADGDQMEIRADALIYQGVTIPATLTAKSLKISANGQTVECPFDVSGDAMNITIGGQALALKRVGGPAGKKGADAGNAAGGEPKAVADGPADAKTLAGTWDSPEGTVIIRADGTTRTGGQEYKYQGDDKIITLSDDKNFLKIPYKLDGDKLILRTRPTKKLTRSAGRTARVCGVPHTLPHSAL